jgi:hypothetical protein
MAGLVLQEAKDAKKLLVSSFVGDLRALAADFDELLLMLLLLEGDGNGNKLEEDSGG